jgi:uncharacterized protein (DUF488 family)
MTTPTLWTVGHSTRPIEDFLEILRAHSITRIADIRRFPGSRKHPQYGRAELARSLEGAGISYTSMPELGGRRDPRPDSPHTALRNASFRGYADYMDTPDFAEAAERLFALARQDRVAIMCSEAVWWRCHRSMVADYFKAHGWTVLHLLGLAEPKEHPYTSAARLVNGQLTY